MLCVGSPAFVAAQPPGGELYPEADVILLTTGPGRAIPSRFGHAALWIRDPATNEGPAFSFGQSRLDSPTDASLLLQGRLLSGGGPEDGARLVARYRGEGRSVWLQTLELTAAARQVLIGDLEARRGLGDPYAFFTANCSTELRDAIDRALEGSLRRQFSDRPMGESPRRLMSGFTAPDPLLHSVTNLLLGGSVDRELTDWEGMFLPMTLREGLRAATLPGPAGSRIPLVRTEEVLTGALPQQTPRPRSPFMWGYLIGGLILGGSMAIMGSQAARRRWARLGFAVLGGAWTLGCGVMGLLILALWAFADPSVGQWNLNLLLANPLALLLAVVLWGGTGPGSLARTLGVVLVGAGILAGAVSLVTPGGQDVAIFLALLLPGHLGLLAGIRQRSGKPGGFSR